MKLVFTTLIEKKKSTGKKECSVQKKIEELLETEIW